MSDAMRGVVGHELKCWPVYFRPIIDGRKTFEIRRGDRPFSVGDILKLREWFRTDMGYSGREGRGPRDLHGRAVGRPRPSPIKDGFVVMGIQLDLPAEKAAKP